MNNKNSHVNKQKMKYEKFVYVCMYEFFHVSKEIILKIFTVKKFDILLFSIKINEI